MKQFTRRAESNGRPFAVGEEVGYAEIKSGYAVYKVDLMVAGVCVELGEDEIMLVCEHAKEKELMTSISYVMHVTRSFFKKALFKRTGSILNRSRELRADQFVEIVLQHECKKPIDLKLFFRGTRAGKRAQKFLDLMRNSEHSSGFDIAKAPIDIGELTWLVVDRTGIRAERFKLDAATQAIEYDANDPPAGVMGKVVLAS